jgi:hypothetical protein
MTSKKVSHTEYWRGKPQRTIYEKDNFVDPTTFNDLTMLNELSKYNNSYIELLSDSNRGLINSYIDSSRNFKLGGKNSEDKDQLQKIILTAPTNQFPFIVWRGHSRDPPIKHKINDELKYDNFVSTSTDYGISVGFLRGSPCCAYEINIPVNTHGLYINKFFQKNEFEYLLPYGTIFKVINIKKVGEQTIYVLNIVVLPKI